MAVDVISAGEAFFESFSWLRCCFLSQLLKGLSRAQERKDIVVLLKGVRQGWEAHGGKKPEREGASQCSLKLLVMSFEATLVKQATAFNSMALSLFLLFSHSLY